MGLTLLEKINSINYPKVLPLGEGHYNTLEDFWNGFISKRMPSTNVMLRWHDVLREYVNNPNAVYAIRSYNNDAKKNYDNLRRGFLSKTNQGYSFFYTDNFHAAYFVKMSLDEFVPTCDELIDAYNSRRFPSRFGPNTINERELLSIPNGIDPGIQNAGYKVAHIINVGKDYFIDNERVLLSNIVKKYFDGGERQDWKKAKDVNGEYFVREYNVDPMAKKYLIAEHLRFVHPFNYFIVPKNSCSTSPICNDIGENLMLIKYVQMRYTELYGDAYKEFLKMALVDEIDLSDCNSKTRIDISFSNKRVHQMAKNNLNGNKKNHRVILNNNDKKEKNQSKHILSEELELIIVKEYLVNKNTSFRKLEKKFLDIDSKARGGGFVAKQIINSYGVTAKEKGILMENSFEQIISCASGTYKDTLKKIKMI